MPEEYSSPIDGFNGVADGGSVDPSTVTATAPADTDGRKRRRRSDAGVPRGSSGPRKKEAQANVDLTSLTGMFVGLHAGIAWMTNDEVWMLSQEEGDAFMKSAQNVMRHYSVTATQKTIDWIAFSGITAQIYGMRLGAMWLRQKQEREARHRPSATVHPFPNATQSNATPPNAAQQPEYVPSVVQPDPDYDAG